MQTISKNIKAAYRARNDSSRLSGVVLVSTPEGHGYCYINFTDEAVTEIGKKMPYGLLPYSKDAGKRQYCGYLRVMYDAIMDDYCIYCCYMGTKSLVQLWRQKQLPSWVSRVKLTSKRSKLPSFFQ